jgi:hypothetical protein
MDPRTEARRFVAQVAERILEGAVTPYDGAREIWRWLSDHKQVGIGELGVFIGLASEWEDSPEDRPSRSRHHRRGPVDCRAIQPTLEAV